VLISEAGARVPIQAPTTHHNPIQSFMQGDSGWYAESESLCTRHRLHRINNEITRTCALHCEHQFLEFLIKAEAPRAVFRVGPEEVRCISYNE
jgi:hypothetical protein